MCVKVRLRSFLRDVMRQILSSSFHCSFFVTFDNALQAYTKLLIWNIKHNTFVNQLFLCYFRMHNSWIRNCLIRWQPAETWHSMTRSNFYKSAVKRQLIRRNACSHVSVHTRNITVNVNCWWKLNLRWCAPESIELERQCSWHRFTCSLVDILVLLFGVDRETVALYFTVNFNVNNVNFDYK